MGLAQQADLLRGLTESLRRGNLPQAPVVRSAVIPAVRREEIEGRTYVTVIPGVPKPERLTRSAIRLDLIFDVAIQRSVPTEKDSVGEVRDLDPAAVAAMMELQRAVMLVLFAFPGVLHVEGINSGAPEHAVQGVWTSVYRVTIRGDAESL